MVEHSHKGNRTVLALYTTQPHLFIHRTILALHASQYVERQRQCCLTLLLPTWILKSLQLCIPMGTYLLFLLLLVEQPASAGATRLSRPSATTTASVARYGFPRTLNCGSEAEEKCSVDSGASPLRTGHLEPPAARQAEETTVRRHSETTTDD